MWLYVPSTSCPSALESDASTSASDSQYPEPELCVVLSGKPTPRPLSWRGWRTRPWVKLLSGTTYSPSTAHRGVESWISSLRASRASRIPWPASDEAMTTSAPSGQNSCASWVKCDPPWYSSKTSQLSLLADTSSQRERNYRDWVTRSKTRSSFVRKTLAHRIDGSGCSSWPTPRASTNEHRTQSMPPSCGKTHGRLLTAEACNWPTPRCQDNSQGPPQSWNETGRGSTLTTAAQHWPTPTSNDMKTQTAPSSKRCGGAKHESLRVATANWPTPRGSDGDKGSPNQAGSKGDAMLTGAAIKWTTPSADDTGASQKKYAQGGTPLSMQTSTWPTCRANDDRATMRPKSCNDPTGTLTGAIQQWPTPAARDVKGSNSESHLERSSGSKHLDQLPNFVSHVFHPAQQTSPPGKSSSSSGQTSRRRLNPNFCELLMGLPVGWTDSTVSATEQFQQWWQSHSALCARLLG